MSRLGGIGHKLYTGELSVDFIGKRKTWYAVSLAVIVIAFLAILLRGMNFSIDFRGGMEFTATLPKASQSAVKLVPTVRSAVVSTGVLGRTEPIVTALGEDRVQVQTEALSATDGDKVQRAIADVVKQPENQVAFTSVGATWGEQITQKGITSLVVFLVLVMLVIWLYFREWRMSVAAIVALVHDLIITVGVYALVGFEVAPATVIGVLTILGYSLYDTVVVFDKVRENTKGLLVGGRMSYSQAANLGVNQTLVRSINTSVMALLPVAGILFVGAGLLGAGTLKDLALALFIGITAGAYSSIFIATPLLCDLKEREPSMRALRARVERRAATSVQRAEEAAGLSDEGAAGGVPGSADADADLDLEGEGNTPGASGASGNDGGNRRPSVTVTSSSGAAAVAGNGSRRQPQRRPRSSRRPKGRGR